MKKARPSSKSPTKPSNTKRAIGGQPENDQDARDAGLSSATSTEGAGKKSRGAGRRAPAGKSARR